MPPPFPQLPPTQPPGTTQYGPPAVLPAEEGYYARSKIAGTAADYYVPGAGPSDGAGWAIWNKWSTKNGYPERKTPTMPTAPVESFAGTNVLNNYRSVSYNFSLSALKKSDINNGTFDSTRLDLVVATSKGKKAASMNNQVDPMATRNNASTTVSATDNPVAIQTATPWSEFGVNYEPVPNATNTLPTGDQVVADLQASTKNKQQNIEKNKGLVNEFNKTSAGKFDLFIDDVDIVSYFAFDKDSGVTLPMEIHFSITEPYSVDGFIEALHAGAAGAGYPDYISASYVLVIDFIGYKDGPGITDPTPLPEATRVIPIRITEMQLSITEEGTVYKVTAIPIGERVFSNAVSSLKTKMTAKGTTVKAMITDLVTRLNAQQTETDNSLGIASGMHDEFEVRFPVYDSAGVEQPGQDNEIASQTFPDIGALSRPMGDIDTTPSAYQQSPLTKGISQSSTISGSNNVRSASFDANQPVASAMTAIIRDSNYVYRLIKAFQQGGDPNDVLIDGQFVNYFMIKPEITELQGSFNKLTNRPYTKYSFVITPYRMLYHTAIPGLGDRVINKPNLSKHALRNYQYIYTGQNTDVIDFKLEFNSLYFDSFPKAFANNQATSAKDGPRPNNGTNTTLKNEPAISPDKLGGIPKAPTLSIPESNRSSVNDQPNAFQQGAESWQQNVKSLHNAVINSTFGLLTGQMSILGDPYFLTAGGSGNYIVKNNKQGQSAGKNEAALSAGQIYITVNFNNPIDIDKNTGLIINSPQTPYSGVFQVTQVRHEFKGGLFKQTLDILRIPGQGVVADTPNSKLGAISKPQDQTAVSTAPPSAPSASTTQNGSQISSSLALTVQSPTTNTPGGLAGSPVPSVIGSAAGLITAQQSVLSAAASIQSAARITGSLIPNSAGAVNTLASQASALNSTLNKQLTSPVLNAANNVTGAINQATRNINYVLSGNAAANFIGNQFGVHPNGLTGLTGAISGALIGSLLGSGTGKKVSTLLGALAGLSATLPRNLDVSRAAAQGLILKGPNTYLPATQALVTNRPDSSNNGFIGPNPVTAATANAQYFDPTVNLNFAPPGGVPSTVLGDKLNSSINLFNNPTGVRLSTEGTQLAISDTVGNSSGSLNSSVAARFGSNSQSNVTSPLIAALNNTNSNIG